nr:hypothetical protein [Desulfobacter sp.]
MVHTPLTYLIVAASEMPVVRPPEKSGEFGLAQGHSAQGQQLQDLIRPEVQGDFQLQKDGVVGEPGFRCRTVFPCPPPINDKAVEEPGHVFVPAGDKSRVLVLQEPAGDGLPGYPSAGMCIDGRHFPFAHVKGVTQAP